MTVKIIKLEKNHCPACVAMRPMLDSILEEYGDEVEFITINVDKQPDAIGAYNLSGVPVLVFKNAAGEEKARIVGMTAPAMVYAAIEKAKAE